MGSELFKLGLSQPRLAQYLTRTFQVGREDIRLGRIEVKAPCRPQVSRSPRGGRAGGTETEEIRNRADGLP